MKLVAPEDRDAGIGQSFPGLRAQASLKHGVGEIQPRRQRRVFPGLSARASLKQRDVVVGLVSAQPFPGLRARASLKQPDERHSNPARRQPVPGRSRSGLIEARSCAFTLRANRPVPGRSRSGLIEALSRPRSWRPRTPPFPGVRARASLKRTDSGQDRREGSGRSRAFALGPH